MKRYYELYKHYGLRVMLKSLFVSIHIQIIRVVACYRPIIMDVHFVGGIELSQSTKNAYIANNKFNLIPNQTLKG